MKQYRRVQGSEGTAPNQSSQPLVKIKENGIPILDYSKGASNS